MLNQKSPVEDLLGGSVDNKNSGYSNLFGEKYKGKNFGENGQKGERRNQMRREEDQEQEGIRKSQITEESGSIASKGNVGMEKQKQNKGVQNKGIKENSAVDEKINLQTNQKQKLLKQSKVKSQKKKVSKQEDQQQATKYFTCILKVINIFLGLGLTAFGAYCYYDTAKRQQAQQFSLLSWILPGYIGLSGLIILIVELHIRFFYRNMKFLYNYFGRGFFNIYAGVMPLTLLEKDSSRQQTSIEKAMIYLLASLMVFIGFLYIFAKIFCCAKEGDKRKKDQKRKNKRKRNLKRDQSYTDSDKSD